MQTKTYPANFFVNSVFYFLLFLLPFSVNRIYFYFNFYYSSHEFSLGDFFWMLLTGIRFDLCVLGFILIPMYVLYWISYIQKIRFFVYLLGQIYKVVVLLAAFVVFHFNIAFMTKNAPFDIPYWLHWPDYRSMVFLDCKICFWDYDYMSSVHPVQIVSGLMFLVVVFSFFSNWNFFSDKVNPKREVVFFVLLALMARGKVGEHHLRYEDSLWHKAPLINSLSNNPLWLINKFRMP